MSKEVIDFRESNPSDSDAINDFFATISVNGRVSLKMKRRIDFFSLYRKLGQNFVNYIFEKTYTNTEENIFSIQKAKKTIVGTASFLFRERVINHQRLKIAYACDLRIAQDRKAIRKWSQHFLPTLEDLKNRYGIDHFISLLNLTELHAINAFLRPKSPYSNHPAYELIKRFNLVTIHGFKPLLYKKNSSISVQFASAQDRSELISYLKLKLHEYDYLPYELRLDIDQYIQNSILYSWNNFVIAKDSHGKIIGCTHPINSSQLQDYFPQKYDQLANNFRQFLKFISFLGFGRKMTKPYSSTNKEQTMNFFVLHFLSFDHPEVLSSLINSIYRMSSNNEFIVYFYQKNNIHKRPPRGTIFSETPYGLFEIKKRNGHHDHAVLSTEKNIYLDDLWF